MTGFQPAAPDDAGRTDSSPGFDIQARFFTGVGAFFFVLSVVYGFVSKEPAGTTMLVLSGGLATLTGAYLGLHQPAAGTHVGESATAGPHAEVEEPWFPHASVWPFVVGLGAVIVANGILIGLWMLLPAGFVLAGAIIGFSRQSRQRA